MDKNVYDNDTVTDDTGGEATVDDVSGAVTLNGTGGGYQTCDTGYENDGVESDADQTPAIDLVLKELATSSPDGINSINGATGNGTVEKTLSFAEADDAGPSRRGEEREEASCSIPIYRYKIIDTVFIFCNVTTMGWIYGQMGPALPDLQIIGGVKLQEATWLFTGFAIGYLGGCLLAGIIQDKFNPRLMLFLYTTGTAVTIGLLPWMPNFIGMVVIRVFNGLCIGGQDTGLHSMLFGLWAKDGGPFLQMTHVLNAAGGIISPLVTQPFLMEPINSSPESPAATNSSAPNTTASIGDMNSTAASTVYPTATREDTNVRYAFLITAILTFAAAVPFLVAVLQKRRIKKTARQYSSDSISRNKLPQKIKIIVLAIIFANSFLATANIDLFPSFLTTFVIQQLRWTQQSASSLTALYFGTYAAGNFVGVFILAYISSTALITFSYVSSSVALTGILLSVIFETPTAVWITVAASGVTMSAILPTLFTWTQQNVTPITGRIASGLLISGSAGVIVNPVLLGYMMELYTPMWFLYLSLGEIVMCAALFSSAFLLSKLCRGSAETKYDVTAKEHDESISDISTMRNTSSPDLKDNKTEIYARGTLYGI